MLSASLLKRKGVSETEAASETGWFCFSRELWRVWGDLRQEGENNLWRSTRESRAAPPPQPQHVGEKQGKKGLKY